MKKVTLIPGDWVGQEMAEAVKEIIAASGVSIEWEERYCGRRALEEEGAPVPVSTIASLKETGVGLRGKLDSGVEKDFINPNILFRQILGLFCNIRPIQNLPGLPSRYENVNFVIVREVTEGIYAGIEHQVAPGVVESLKVVTEKASRRIAREAFDYAKRHERKKVTTVHKANIMKLSDGLFLQMAQETAKNYTGIHHDNMIVDNVCMQLVMNPYQFDVLLIDNLYGDIVADLGCALVGGICCSPSISTNGEVTVFECTHGNAPDIVGKNLANPIPLLTPAQYLLKHLGEHAAAEKISCAVEKTLKAGIKTKDLGGTAAASEITKSIIENL